MTSPRHVHAVMLVGAAFAAAWLLPGHALGLGVLIVALLLVASVRASSASIDAEGRLFLCAGVALALPVVALDATWVVLPSLAMSLTTMAMVSRRPRALRDVGAAVVAPFRLAGGGRMAVAEVRDRIPDKVHDHVRPLLRGTAVSVFLIAVFGALFVTADRAFAQLAEQVFAPHVDVALLPARMLAAILTFSVAGALVRRAEEPASTFVERLYTGTEVRVVLPRDPVVQKRARPMLEWGLPLILLDLLFLSFVAVQFAVFFGGRHHVLRTAGLTYAEYARSGFFQLLIVAVLTAVVVGGARRLVVLERASDRRTLEVLLGGLCLLSLIVLVSALYRLGLYEDAYGFTRARFSARIAMYWIAVLLILTFLSGWVDRVSRMLIPAMVVFSVLVMGAIAVSDPDTRIARGNVDRFERTGRIDVAYLTTLSADAVPELLRLEEPYRSCALADARRADEPWAAANLSRSRARALLSDLPSGAGAACRDLAR